jgi:hypothetical protein
MMRIIDPSSARPMEPFPIYDTLLVHASEQSIQGGPSIEQWSRWAGVIAELPDEHIGVLYALILHHNELEQRLRGGRLKGEGSIPYSGRLLDVGKGVMYQGGNLPVILQWIVGGFLERIST